MSRLGNRSLLSPLDWDFFFFFSTSSSSSSFSSPVPTPFFFSNLQLRAKRVTSRLAGKLKNEQQEYASHHTVCCSYVIIGHFPSNLLSSTVLSACPLPSPLLLFFLLNQFLFRLQPTFILFYFPYYILYSFYFTPCRCPRYDRWNRRLKGSFRKKSTILKEPFTFFFFLFYILFYVHSTFSTSFKHILYKYIYRYHSWKKLEFSLKQERIYNKIYKIWKFCYERKKYSLKIHVIFTVK